MPPHYTHIKSTQTHPRYPFSTIQNSSTTLHHAVLYAMLDPMNYATQPQFQIQIQSQMPDYLYIYDTPTSSFLHHTDLLSPQPTSKIPLYALINATSPTTHRHKPTLPPDVYHTYTLNEASAMNSVVHASGYAVDSRWETQTEMGARARDVGHARHGCNALKRGLIGWRRFRMCYSFYFVLIFGF